MDIDISEFLDDLIESDFSLDQIEDETTSSSKSEHLKIDMRDNDPLLILKTIDNFSDVHSNRKHSSVYLQALGSIVDLKGIGSAALFQIADDFDFYLRSVIPPDSDVSVKDIFDNVTKIGRVGKALQTGIHIEINQRDGIEDRACLFPLIYNNNIWGFLLVVFDENFDATNYIEAIDIYSRIIAANLKSNELKDQFGALKKEQAQLISMKTTELQNNRRELNTIIDTVQAGIILGERGSNKIISINPFAESFSGYRNEELNKSEKRLSDLFDSYNVVFGPMRDKLITKGGRTVDVIRNSNIIKLSDRDTIVETFVDISFVSDIKKEYLVEKKILLDAHKNEIESLRKAWSEKRTSSVSSYNDGEIHNITIASDFLKRLNYNIREHIAHINLYTQLLNNDEKIKNTKTYAKYSKTIKDSIEMISSVMENVFYIDMGNNSLFADTNVEHLISQVLQKVNKDGYFNILSQDVKSSVININQHLFIKVVSNILAYLRASKINSIKIKSHVYGDYLSLSIDTRNNIQTEKEINNLNLVSEDIADGIEKKFNYLKMAKYGLEQVDGKLEVAVNSVESLGFVILFPLINFDK